MLLDELFPQDQQQIDEALSKWHAMAAAMGLGALAQGAMAAPPQRAHPPVEIAAARVVPGVHPNYPQDLHKGSQEPEARRATFKNTMVPLIQQANNEIQQDRHKLRTILNKGEPTAQDQEWLENKMRMYRADNAKDLLKRIDTIPTSLVLAQGALESGWGTDAMSKRALNFFGQKTTSTRDYYGSPKTRYARFESPVDSIHSYMMNLNSHPAYEHLRQIRANLRSRGKEVTGIDLLPGLLKYSTRGADYVKELRGMIQQHFRNVNGG